MATATVTTPTTAATTGRCQLSFGGVLKSELTKLFSLRSTYWLFGLTFVGYVALAMLVAANATFEGSPLDGRDGAQLYLLSVMPAQIIAVAIGAIVVTGEYSTGSIRSTLAAAPGRISTLLAKSILVATSVGVITALSMLAAIPAGKAFQSSTDLHIMTSEFWLAMAGGLVYLVGIALISVALGMLIRSTAGAVCAGLGVILILPVVFGEILANYDWATEIYKYLPASLMTPMTVAPLTTAGGQNMSALAAAGVLAAWIAVLGVAGAFRLVKTDA